MNTTLFRKKSINEFLVVHIYVVDIIFGSTNENLYQEFSISKEFEMSIMK